MAARLCLEPGCHDLGSPRCSAHTRAPARRTGQANRRRDLYRGSRQSRGYGAQHDRASAQLKAQLVDGLPCGRCGEPLYRWQLALGPHDPQGIDAGHADERPASNGWPPERLEHRGACNRAAAARQRAAGHRG